MLFVSKSHLCVLPALDKRGVSLKVSMHSPPRAEFMRAEPQRVRL